MDLELSSCKRTESYRRAKGVWIPFYLSHLLVNRYRRATRGKPPNYLTITNFTCSVYPLMLLQWKHFWRLEHCSMVFLDDTFNSSKKKEILNLMRIIMGRDNPIIFSHSKQDQHSILFLCYYWSMSIIDLTSKITSITFLYLWKI